MKVRLRERKKIIGLTTTEHNVKTTGVADFTLCACVRENN